jgi:hypothetical protein
MTPHGINLTGIGLSYLQQKLKSKISCIYSIKFGYDSKTFENYCCLNLRDRETAIFMIPNRMKDVSPHLILSEIENFLYFTFKENYPEYFI